MEYFYLQRLHLNINIHWWRYWYFKYFSTFKIYIRYICVFGIKHNPNFIPLLLTSPCSIANTSIVLRETTKLRILTILYFIVFSLIYIKEVYILFFVLLIYKGIIKYFQPTTAILQKLILILNSIFK